MNTQVIHYPGAGKNADALTGKRTSDANTLAREAAQEQASFLDKQGYKTTVEPERNRNGTISGYRVLVYSTAKQQDTSKVKTSIGEMMMDENEQFRKEQEVEKIAQGIETKAFYDREKREKLGRAMTGAWMTDDKYYSQKEKIAKQGFRELNKARKETGRQGKILYNTIKEDPDIAFRSQERYGSGISHIKGGMKTAIPRRPYSGRTPRIGGEGAIGADTTGERKSKILTGTEEPKIVKNVGTQGAKFQRPSGIRRPQETSAPVMIIPYNDRRV